VRVVTVERIAVCASCRETAAEGMLRRVRMRVYRRWWCTLGAVALAASQNASDWTGVFDALHELWNSDAHIAQLVTDALVGMAPRPSVREQAKRFARRAVSL
jgi:hypothetical protein